MTLKLKRGLLTPAADATPEDFIIIDDHTNTYSAADGSDDFAPAVSTAAPMQQLADMERYAQLALQTVSSSATEPLRSFQGTQPQSTPKGAYVHYIPQFYLH